jgi:hypothetical protein
MDWLAMDWRVEVITYLPTKVVGDQQRITVESSLRVQVRRR